MPTAKRGVCCQCQSAQLVVPNPEGNPLPGGDPEGEWPEGDWVMGPHLIPGTLMNCDGEGTCPQSLIK